MQLMNTNQNQKQSQAPLGNPLELINALLGASGNLPEQKKVKKDLAANEQTLKVRESFDAGRAAASQGSTKSVATDTPITSQMKEILGKVLAIQGAEAIAQGVPYKHVMEQTLNQELQFNQYQDKIINSLNGGVPVEQENIVPETVSPVVNNQEQLPTAGIINKPKGMFSGASVDAQGNVFNEGVGNKLLRELIGISGPSVRQVAGDVAAVQKIQGKEPMQQGEREKLGLEAKKLKDIEDIKAALELDKERIKLSAEEEKAAESVLSPILAPPKLTEAERQDQDLAIVGLEAANELSSILTNNPNALKELNVPGNKLGQKVAALAQQMRMAILRKESKAAITNQEIDIFKKMGTTSGISAILRDPKLNAEMLNNMGRRFQRILESTDPNKEDRDLVKFLITEKGYSRKEAADALKKWARR